MKKLIMLGLLGLSLVPASSAIITHSYTASSGFLPSAQGWDYGASSVWCSGLPPLAETNFTVSSGMLIQALTGDPCQYQWYSSTNLVYRFDTDQVRAFVNLQIITSSMQHPDDPPNMPNRRAGWSVLVRDQRGYHVQFFLGSSGFFLLGRNEESTGVIPFNSTDGFHSYRLDVDSSGARLLVDGTPRASLRMDQFRNDGVQPAAFIIGDQTINNNSSSELTVASITVERQATPATIQSIAVAQGTVTLQITNLTTGASNEVLQTSQIKTTNDWQVVGSFISISASTNWFQPFTNGSSEGFYRLRSR